jgi:Uma2 family endonuclease
MQDLLIDTVDTVEDVGLPDEYHILQSQLLSRTFCCDRYPSERLFTGGDLSLHYDVRSPQAYKCPDWFLVVGVSRFHDATELRTNYVVWKEGVNPFVVVELLAQGTEHDDELGPFVNAEQAGERSLALRNFEETPPRKWDVYEQILRVPYYGVFDRHNAQLRVFQLVGGHYQEQKLDPREPKIWVPELGVGLALWNGEFEGMCRQWLRWYRNEGEWVLTDTEYERQRAEQAEVKLQQVTLNLLQEGLPVEQVARLTGLPKELVQKQATELK